MESMTSAIYAGTASHPPVEAVFAQGINDLSKRIHDLEKRVEELEAKS